MQTKGHPVHPSAHGSLHHGPRAGNPSLLLVAFASLEEDQTLRNVQSCMEGKPRFEPGRVSARSNKVRYLVLVGVCASGWAGANPLRVGVWVSARIVPQGMRGAFCFFSASRAVATLP